MVNINIGWMCAVHWILLLQQFSRVTGLRDLRITVPEAVAVGDTVTIACYYDLENAALYSVRWYFNGEEFYRFVPKESPPARVFPISGVTVDLNKSGEHMVTLRTVQRSQSGSYQCEVSADAPLFHTEHSTASMLVADLPTSEPVMTVYGMPPATPDDHRRTVTMGETFKTTCVSGPSYPPVNFTWYVNDVRQMATNSGLRDINAAIHYEYQHSPYEHNAIATNSNATVNLTTVAAAASATGSQPSPPPWNTQEAWSELVVLVDSSVVAPNERNRRISIRCAANIYELYRGAANSEVHVADENYWVTGGKVSPTIDQRGGANRGDPDNSALTGGAMATTLGAIVGGSGLGGEHWKWCTVTIVLVAHVWWSSMTPVRT